MRKQWKKCYSKCKKHIPLTSTHIVPLPFKMPLARLLAFLAEGTDSPEKDLFDIFNRWIIVYMCEPTKSHLLKFASVCLLPNITYISFLAADHFPKLCKVMLVDSKIAKMDIHLSCKMKAFSCKRSSGILHFKECRLACMIVTKL